MKILIVGSKKIWAIENLYSKYFRELGIESDIYPIHDYFYDYYYKNIINKLLYRINSKYIFKKLNQDFLLFMASRQYDVVWVFKGMELFPETIKCLKHAGTKMVNFNPDHPFYFSGRGSGNANVFESIEHYEMHLCYHTGVMQRIEQEYHIPCLYLPFGYEPSPVSFPSEKDEILKACFIGNPDTIRAGYIQALIDQSIPVDVYGNDWKRFITPSPSTGIFDAIYRDDLNRIAPLYRVQLNIFRAHNIGSHNMRTFEMPGLGCIMVAPKSPEHEDFFVDKKEAFFYETIEELKQIIHQLLAMPYKDCMEIRHNAISRSTKCGYDYKSRANQVFNKLANAFNT